MNKFHREQSEKLLERDAKLQDKWNSKSEKKVSKKNSALASSYMNRIKDKARDFAERGWISTVGELDNMEHSDLMILNNKIQKIEHEIAQRTRDQERREECTFTPAILSAKKRTPSQSKPSE